MVAIGHRGACGYEPENTLISFAKALELGVGMVEFDVFALKDGNLVAIHDDTLERTTNGIGLVISKTFEELKELDAGKGQQIPTAAEVLELINKRVPVNIELKGKDTAGPVAELIRRYIKDKGWRADNFLVSSFNRKELRKFSKLMPEIKTAVLFSGRPLRLKKLIKSLSPYSINLNKSFISKRRINAIHNLDCKVFVYTVNEESDIMRMKNLGVDGVFSDFPDRVKA